MDENPLVSQHEPSDLDERLKHYTTRPETPQADPGTPTNPSAYWVGGYNDGWNGVWIAPLQWLVASDYRSGWMKGRFDGEHGFPNAFAPQGQG